jgi:hypothetical protein
MPTTGMSTGTSDPSRPNPCVGFDFERATALQFKQLVADFTEWSRQQPEPTPLGFTDGWTTFTPEHALNFLQRTVLDKGNRKPSFQTVLYYALQMKAEDWVKTGQSILIDTAGKPLDGQHRAWASLLSGVSFPTYVIASVPPTDNVFAFIDNCKSRGPADALETAGMNGQSRILTAVVKIARHYDAGVMTATSKGNVARPSPIDVIRFVLAYPKLRDAVHLQSSEYRSVSELMGSSYVGPFTAWKIVEAFDEDVLEDFMTGIANAEPTRGSNDPLVALRMKLEANQNAEKPMKGHQVLAHVIKAFNAWRQGQPLKTVTFRVDETFPRFITSDPVAEAA